MRLIDHPVYRVWHRRVTRAWIAFDRSTAYGCVQRDRVFDPQVMAQLWDEYQRVTNSVNWNEIDV